jgi:hypothetical protein
MNGCFRRAVLRFTPKRNVAVERANEVKGLPRPPQGIGGGELLPRVAVPSPARDSGGRKPVGRGGLVSDQWKRSRRLKVSIWEEAFWNKELIPARVAKQGLVDRKRILLENGLETGAGSV